MSVRRRHPFLFAVSITSYSTMLFPPCMLVSCGEHRLVQFTKGGISYIYRATTFSSLIQASAFSWNCRRQAHLFCFPLVASLFLFPSAFTQVMYIASLTTGLSSDYCHRNVSTRPIRSAKPVVRGYYPPATALSAATPTRARHLQRLDPSMPRCLADSLLFRAKLNNTTFFHPFRT